MQTATAPGSRDVARFGATWAGRDLTSIGDGMLLVGLLAWSYSDQESASAAATLLLARLLPPLVLTPLAARLVGERRLLAPAMGALLLQAVALLLALTSESGPTRPLVLAVALAAALPPAFVGSLQRSLLESILQGRRVVEVEKALSDTGLVSATVGPALGTALFMGGGFQSIAAAALLATIASAATLALAAGASRTAASARPMRPESCAWQMGPWSAEISSSWEGFLDGLAASLKDPALRVAALVQTVAALATGGMAVAQVAGAVWIALSGAEYVGLILAGQAAGMGLSSLALRSMVGRAAIGTLLPPSLGIAAAACFALAISQDLLWAIVSAAALGFGCELLSVDLSRAIADRSPQELLPSVRSSIGTATAMASLVSVIAMGGMVDILSPRLAIVPVSIVLCVLALYALGAWSNEDALPKRV